MCTVCGCDGKDAGLETGDGVKKPHAHHHHHDHGHDHHHDHEHHHHHHDHTHEADGSLHFGKGPAGTHVPGESQARLVEIERNILSKNDAIAAQNRMRLARSGVLAVNLMSSPGSGKTTLLVRTIEALKGDLPVAVIEGDQQTSNDAARIRATGVPAIQVNTGKGCHLDAEMTASALDHMTTPKGGILFIENVGNLVCPAAFDLGESVRAVVVSVTEGEDKPLKYPEMFATADVMVVSKTDLVPHLDVDVEALIANARKVKPGLEVVRTEIGKAGEDLADWLGWLSALKTGGEARAAE